jgi:uncharacterized protein YyaL (SSP411 family)
MSNRLSAESSPYLLQHASNPVNWQPWDAQALTEARDSGKPILLSVGYSACHWCHVMAHECFEDEATAALMNALYVNIKVDREERPDLDRIYQLAHHLIAQSPGGWPLTVFLTPDEHLPIFSGTYFPRETFKQVLERVAEYHREHADEVRRHGEALRGAFDQLTLAIGDVSPVLDAEPLSAARMRLLEEFDPEHGGFGGAPKFPHPTHLDVLMQHWRATAESRTPDLEALFAATLTLTRMAEGGLYDQLGGGFFRYSVDDHWGIPHFEKMLYDNAALLGVYADAYAATGEPLFGRVANETADWVLRDMRDTAGGFYATLDADSEGVEGKFYVWTRDELESLLEPAEYSIAAQRFGLDGPPNFEHGRWHLRAAERVEALTPTAEAPNPSDALEAARRKLLDARSRRIWPMRDDKILTAWNGLMIGSLARAARRLDRPELADAAAGALDFLRTSMWDGNRLLAASTHGTARFNAYLDDYAFLGRGIVELLQTRWKTEDLRFAIGLADALLANFEAPDGGFYFTARNHEQLIHRPKPFADEAVPSGNGAAAQLLLALGHLLGEPRYLAAAERAVQAAWPALTQFPHAHGTLLAALSALIEPHEIIVLRGPADEMSHWQRFLNAGFNPTRLVFAIDSAAGALPGLLDERAASRGTIAYVCRGTTCQAPIDTLETLAAALGGARSSS